LWNVISTKIPDGRSAGIHWRADIGRSGLVTGNVLLQLGVSEAAAWRRVSMARECEFRIPTSSKHASAWYFVFAQRIVQKYSVSEQQDSAVGTEIPAMSKISTEP
jgi:hypothetical protein